MKSVWKRRCSGLGLIVLSLGVLGAVGCGPSPRLRVQAEERYRLAQQYLGTQSYLLAEQEIRAALDSLPHEPKYFELLGLIYQAQDQWGRAEEAYQIALQDDQVPSSVLVNYSALLILLERYDEAIRFANQALKNPGYAKPALVHTNLGLAYIKKNQLTRAEEHLQVALEYQPSLPEAHHNLGLVYTRMGKHAQAMQAFRRAIRVRPAYAESFASLGHLFLAGGRLDEARDAFERVIALAPDSDMAVVSRRQLNAPPLR